MNVNFFFCWFDIIKGHQKLDEKLVVKPFELQFIHGSMNQLNMHKNNNMKIDLP